LKDSTVRTVLRRLDEKGFVTHDVEGRTFIFRPVQDRRKVAAKAVRRIADWFCNGSIQDVLVGIVDAKMLNKKQLEQLIDAWAQTSFITSRSSSPSSGKSSSMYRHLQ
jgi:predicted transcriptional regulator